MIQEKPSLLERLTTGMIGRLPTESLPVVVETAMARMEEKQRDKALYEAVRKYKGKAHIHKDPVRKKEEAA